MSATNISFKTCVYPASILITLFISNGTRHSRSWCSRTHSACENSVRFPIPINTDIYHYSFVTLLLELLSANHTEASSHNNAAFCHVMFSVYARAFSARELLESPAKFAGLDIRNTFSFERKKDCEKLLDVVPSANYLCTHLTERIQLSDYVHRPLRTNLNSIQQ